MVDKMCCSLEKGIFDRSRKSNLKTEIVYNEFEIYYNTEDFSFSNSQVAKLVNAPLNHGTWE